LISAPWAARMSVRGFGRSRPLAWKWRATCKRIQTMVFEHIEKLQEEYMDKYVVVDDECPELRRFKGMTGVVKTVNMSGHALVQFDSNNNIGWYDIDVDYLKVVDKPLPKEEPQLARRAAPPKPAETPAAPANEPSSNASVDDVLAAARAGTGPAKPAQEAPAASDKEEATDAKK
jgi:hypothetical protein